MRQITQDRDFIRVVDGVIPPELCGNIIDLFHRAESRHREVPGRMVELDLLALKLEQDPDQPLIEPETLEAITLEFMNAMVYEVDEYRSQWDPNEMLPVHWGAEGFRVKQYRPGEHEFRLHADVGHKDSAERFIGVLFYLNDVPDAPTVFPNQDLTVDCKEGRILIFPPMWPWPHQGQRPLGKSKYVMTTYQRFAF